MAPRPPAFTQLDLFADAPAPKPKADAPGLPTPLPTAPAPKPVSQTPLPPLPPILWTTESALRLLGPEYAELVLLNLGLKQRRPHQPQEIAMVLARPLKWVEQGLTSSYALLAYKLKTGQDDPADAQLVRLRARLSLVKIGRP